MAITNQQLRDAFLNPQMHGYFEKKLPSLSSAEVLIRVEETLKFLNMATYFQCNIPVTKELDDVWHYWILETREYSQLCAKLQGGRFIHHSSNVYLNSGSEENRPQENDLEEEVAMLGTYALNYGPFERDRVKYWLFAAYLIDTCGWSLERLNDWLMSAAVSPHMCGSHA
ncbi:MAG: hypothetical protein WCF61_04745 [Terriglobales bacterium]